MSQCAVFEVSINLFDDRMLAMGLIGRHGIQIAYGEERGKRCVSKRVGCPSPAFWFSSGIRRTTRRPSIRSDFLRELNAVKVTSATSADEIQAPLSSSRIASV